MSRRKLLPVESVPFVGGCLAIDFVNTTGARSSRSQRERLGSYGDVLVWSRRAGMLTHARARRMHALAQSDPQSARRVVSKLRKTREILYRVLRAAAEGTPPDDDDFAFVDRLARAERQRYELTRGASRYELARRERPDELDSILWPIVASAVDLLTSIDVERLKRCGECDWLFVDETKNGTRRWCKKVCGDRVRARRHYARHKVESLP